MGQVYLLFLKVFYGAFILTSCLMLRWWSTRLNQHKEGSSAIAAQCLVSQNLATAAAHLFFYVREIDPSHKAINEANRRFAQSLLRPDNRTRLRYSWWPHKVEQLWKNRWIFSQREISNSFCSRITQNRRTFTDH